MKLVGPMASNPRQMFGDYASDMDLQFTSTPLTALKPVADNVKYAAGCTETKCEDVSNIPLCHPRNI